MEKRLQMEKIEIFIVSKPQMRSFLESKSLSDENIEDQKDLAIISINDNSSSFWGVPFFVNPHPNVLTLKFDDVEESGKASPTNNSRTTQAFSKDQGLEVLDFLDRNRDKKILIVHCAAGISRSGAVGQFALGYLDGNREGFKIRNSHIMPNARVLRILNNLVNGYEEI